jgi:hypothetical protein
VRRRRREGQPAETRVHRPLPTLLCETIWRTVDGALRQKWQVVSLQLGESSKNRHTREHTRFSPIHTNGRLWTGRKLTVRSLKEAEPCGGRGWRATVPQATEGLK